MTAKRKTRSETSTDDGISRGEAALLILLLLMGVGVGVAALFAVLGA